MTPPNHLQHLPVASASSYHPQLPSHLPDAEGCHGCYFTGADSPLKLLSRESKAERSRSGKLLATSTELIST